ncbi:hypothetical protein QJQ45_004051 [Haematococcus lacustris]|nr:hypothetical protein QJQ45_004051 [Haematococcus lacustris]
MRLTVLEPAAAAAGAERADSGVSCGIESVSATIEKIKLATMRSQCSAVNAQWDRREAIGVQEAPQPAASEPGPSTPPPAKRCKRTKAKQAAEPTQPTKAAKAKPAPQPGRWLDRDCNAALNMQRIGESRWRPLELCWWPEQGALPAKGKEYPGLGYTRLRDKPPKPQQQQQQPFELSSAYNQCMFSCQLYTIALTGQALL